MKYTVGTFRKEFDNRELAIAMALAESQAGLYSFVSDCTNPKDEFPIYACFDGEEIPLEPRKTA